MSVNASTLLLWDRYREYRYDAPELGLSLDVSRVRFERDYLARMAAPISSAMDAMEALEAGAVANGDERRMVGHYWLRAPGLAPIEELTKGIKNALASVHAFAEQVHSGALRGADGRFEHIIHVGIGGSTLGPQLICEALAANAAPVSAHFLDNADPDGIDRLIEKLNGALGRTLVSVVSKSGWTPTPRYVQLELEAIYRRMGLDFSRHAVATTLEGSDLERQAIAEGWLARFPLWEWVGGRTSITSAVGLLPAALQGVDIDAFLDGAAAMDRLTRQRNSKDNPAALLALMWHWLGNGRGDKHMVILPYKDRLALLARYVQQLVMESLGKRLDRNGAIVHQGLTVYGNKGSTDQHSYVQQLREGTDNFFVTFIRIDNRRAGKAIQIMPEVTLGDYLFASLEGTRNALYENGRDSITITLPDLTPSSLGALVALFERAVGLYAELINVNAYHQPGVDKRIAAGVADLQREVTAYLKTSPAPQTAEEVAHGIGKNEQVETVYKLLEYLATDPSRGISVRRGPTPFAGRFWNNRRLTGEAEHESDNSK
jgi:glucose-6-phosphate isomerase